MRPDPAPLRAVPSPRTALIRVEPGYEVHAHGRTFGSGQTLYLPTRHADRLERHGYVRREIG